MKLISWNVNGLRACVTKGFLEYFKEADADIFCIQETKLQEGQIELDLPGYYQYWNYAERKGYSGTAVFTKKEPLSVAYGIGIPEHDKEGRVITLEFPEFYLVTVYTPNSQNELARLDYRMEWEDAFLAYLKNLEKNKPVVFCGDLNVAQRQMCIRDRYSILPCPKGWSLSAGFSAIFTPTKLMIDDPASDRLLNASAVTETLWSTRPTINFTIKRNTLQKIPTMLASTPYAVRTDIFSTSL